MKKEVIPIKFEGALVETLEQLVETGIYSSKAEAIREGLRLLGEKHGIKITPAFYFRSLVREKVSKKKVTKEELDKTIKKVSEKAWIEERKKYG
jgi:Arc/MetJ-type ribon-helix-helix transcriptional regulator